LKKKVSEVWPWGNRAVWTTNRKNYVRVFCFFGKMKSTSSALFLSSLGFSMAGPSFYKYASIPTPRSGAVGGIIYDKYNSPEVWVVGGTNSELGNQAGGVVEAYSANWDEWRSIGSLATPRAELGAAPINGTLFAGGGLVACESELCPTNTVEVYSSETNSWTAASPMNIARSGHFFAAEDVSGVMYALGGVDSSEAYLSSVEMFDIKTNQWTALTSMPTPRVGLSAVVLDSKLYAVGGCGGSAPLDSCEALSTVEMYDPQTNAWSTLPSLLRPRHSFSLGVYGTQLILAGGSSSSGLAPDGTGLVKSIDIFDIVANEWFVVTSLPDPRAGLVKGYNLFVGISMFLISGVDASNALVNTNELMALMCYRDRDAHSTSKGDAKVSLNHPFCP
jgi:hypothetical protein